MAEPKKASKKKASKKKPAKKKAAKTKSVRTKPVKNEAAKKKTPNRKIFTNTSQRREASADSSPTKKVARKPARKKKSPPAPRASIRFRNILGQGVPAWNEWRDKNPDIEPVLDGLKMSGAKLSGANMRGVRMRNAYLYEADLTGVDFSFASLDRSNFEGADMRSAVLDDTSAAGARFANALLQGASIQRAKAHEAQLVDVKLQGARIYGTTFRYASLVGVQARDAILEDVDFTHANLEGASLARSFIGHSTFDSSKLYDTEFREAMIVGCRFTGSTEWNTETNFANANYVDLKAIAKFSTFVESDAFEVDDSTASKFRLNLRRQIAQSEASYFDDQPIERLINDHSVSREASDEELGLQVHEYAQVLDTLFREAQDDDFCFALFGPWGRGKTRLVSEFVKRLVRPPDYADDLRYEVVHFSAWKYRATPEVWVHLYETFRLKCVEGRFWHALPRILRAGVERHGYWPLAGIIASFGIGVTSLASLSILDPRLFGFLAVGPLQRMYSSGKKSISGLAKKYAAFANHREKLGLQSAIGDDLEAMLRGWIPDSFRWPEERTRQFSSAHGSQTKSPPLRTWRAPAIRWLRAVPEDWPAVASWLLVAPLIAWSSAAEFSAFVPLPGDSLGWMLSVGVPSVLALAWLFSGFLLQDRVRRGSRETQKILLTVDDLDRCSPEQMLEIVESLKLLLEDEEIKKRVQIIMMVEERALYGAIQAKFADLIEYRTGADSGTLERVQAQVVREHIEKLFVAHVRLGRLRIEEVQEIAAKFVGWKRRVDGDPLEESLERREFDPEEPVDESIESNDPIETPVKSSVTPTPKEVSVEREIERGLKLPQRPPEERVRFSEQEKNLLMGAINELRDNAPLDRSTPRAIRAFVQRYKLGRLILEHRDGGISEPDELIGALLAISLGDHMIDNYSGVIRDVAEQVS